MVTDPAPRGAARPRQLPLFLAIAGTRRAHRAAVAGRGRAALFRRPRPRVMPEHRRARPHARPHTRPQTPPPPPPPPGGARRKQPAKPFTPVPPPLLDATEEQFAA